MSQLTVADIAKAIRNIPDFPKAGIQFKDITPVLADPKLFAATIALVSAPYKPGSIDIVAGIDAPWVHLCRSGGLAARAGFVPIRKKGKLPYKTFEQSYDLEYGSNTIAIHQDAIKPGARVLLVDDLLATGGTAKAAVDLLKRAGGNIQEAIFLIELGFLNGRAKLAGLPIRSLVTF